MGEKPHPASLERAAAFDGALMAGRLTRFLHLETARAPDDGPPHEVASKGRFDERPRGNPAQEQRLAEEQQRALGEMLARAVAERERARLGWWGMGVNPTPLGVRLLMGIESAAVRVGVGIGAGCAFVAAIVVAAGARSRSRLQFGATLVAAVLAALFTPSSSRWRRRGWWWSDRY